MPYEVIERDGEHCVRKVGTDEIEGCHESTEEAQAHLTALNINVDKGDTGVSTAKVAYIIKAVSVGNEWVLEILGAPYGGPNRGKDAHGEFFSPRTNFYENEGAPLPLIAYYHGFTPEGKPQGDPEIIGVATARWRDDQGLWFKAVLKKTSALAKRVWEAAGKDKARASSGVAGLMGRTRQSGEITHWLMGELSVWDVAPGRQPANNYAVARPAIKALFGSFLTDEQTDPVGAEAQGQAVDESDNVLLDLSAEEVIPMADENTTETNITPPELPDIDSVVNNAVKSALDAQEASRLKREEDAQAEQDRVDAAVEVARVKWESENAADRRLPSPVDGTPNVAKFSNLWKYDNLEPGDMAFVAGMMRGMNRTPSENLLKAMAVSISEGEQREFNRTRGIMRASGIPVKANELNQSTLASYGDEWCLDAVDMALWERIWSNAGIVNKLPTVEVPQGYESITIPLQSAPPTFYKVAQASAQDTNTLGKVTYTVTSSKMGTGSQSLTVGKLGARTIYTGELEEDSIIPWANELRNSMAMEAVEVLESLIIDGDTETGATTNINDIGGTPAGTEYWLVFNGLRKLALVTNTANSRSNGALTAEDFLETLKLMGLQGKNAAQRDAVSFIVDAATNWEQMALPEAKTRDVYGAPTFENGQLTQVYGREVITSWNMHRANQDATYGLLANSAGKVDLDTAANNLYGAILAVRWDQWRFGWKRRITFETQRVPQADATDIVCLMRCGLINRDAEASAISYGVTV